MCDLFSSTQKQNSKTNSSQTGTSTTQNNAWDQIQPYFQSFMNQYSPGNYSQTGTPNLYQSEAGANQGQVANAGTLQPAFSAANGVAGSGITTADIQGFMSPYIQNVVNPTLQAQDIQNKQALSNLDGNHAMRGALGNNTGAGAAYLAGVQPGQQAQIASLYDQGYNQAANTAASSAGLKLQGANAAGSLSNAATGANQGLFNVGQGIYNTSLTPYQLANQGVSGLTGLAGLAGSKVNTSGTSTGNSSGTTTSSPSLGSIILGGLGTLMSGFKEGGAVPAYAGGGGVSSAAMMPFASGDDMATKVGKSFKMLHGLKTAAQGGKIDSYDVGGVVPFGAWNQPSPIGTEDGGPIGNWETTVTPEPKVPAFNSEKVGQSVMGMADKLGQTPQSNMGDNGLGQSQAGLSSFLGGLSQSVRPAYDDGGIVKPFQYGGDEPRAEAVMEPAQKTEGWSWKMPFTSGVWAGEKPSSMQRFGAALSQIGDGPFAPFGKAVMDQQGIRFKELEAQRLAEAAQMDAKRFGMEEQIMPHKVALIEAQLRGAQQDVDPVAQEARRLGLDKTRAEIEALRTKADDPIAEMIVERLKRGRGVPATTSGAPSSTPSLPPATLQPQSLEGSPQMMPGVILAADEQPVPAPVMEQPDANMVKTPYGDMTREEARELGGAMLLSPKYSAAGKAILDSIGQSGDELSKPAATQLDERTISAASTLGRLQNIRAQFKPEFLQIPEKAKLLGASWGAAFGGKLSPELEGQLKDFSAFKATAFDNFNQLLKELSGTAVSAQELARQKIVQPNPGEGIFDGDDPVTFLSKIEQGEKIAKSAVARMNYMRTRGINFNKDTAEQFLRLEDVPAAIDRRGAEIEQQLRQSNPSADPMSIERATQQRLKQEFGI